MQNLKYKLRKLQRKLNIPIKQKKIIAVNGIRFGVDLNERIDNHLFYNGFYEKNTTEIIKSICKQNMNVLDIGANIGVFTLLFSQLLGEKGKVFAIEPTEYAFNKLLFNIQLNESKNIFPYKVAISNENKINNEVLLASSWPIEIEKNTSEIMHPKHGGRLINALVDFVTLDFFLEKNSIDKVDLIKCDVDGFEYKVFSGAYQMLEKHRPIILMEISNYTLAEKGDSALELLKIFQKLEYRIIKQGDLSEITNFSDYLETIPPDSTDNILMIAKKESMKIFNKAL